MSPEDSPVSVTPPEPPDAETGLPMLRSWSSVYYLVLVTFCVWIILLTVLPFLFA